MVCYLSSMCAQGDSEGSVIIFGDDVCHCDKEYSYQRVSSLSDSAKAETVLGQVLV